MLERQKDELRVRSIKNGTVIDHITAGTALNVLKILGVKGGTRSIVSVVMNVPSKKPGNRAKDIVKIEDRELNSNEVDKIALIAPNATINIIRDYEVVQKSSVELPGSIENIGQCPNPNCISNTDEPVTAKFAVIHPLALRCLYCERIIKNNIVEHLI